MSGFCGILRDLLSTKKDEKGCKWIDQCLIGQVENLLPLTISKNFACNGIYSGWIICLKSKWKLKHKKEEKIISREL